MNLKCIQNNYGSEFISDSLGSSITVKISVFYICKRHWLKQSLKIEKKLCYKKYPTVEFSLAPFNWRECTKQMSLPTQTYLQLRKVHLCLWPKLSCVHLFYHLDCRLSNSFQSKKNKKKPLKIEGYTMNLLEFNTILKNLTFCKSRFS